jgi:RimJ/RimL family protein N-acetyltransferase
VNGTLIPFSPAAAVRLSPLFTGDYPVPIRLWAILEGTCEGRILVDNPDAPAWALIQELAEGTTYVGGVIDPVALADAVASLRQFQDVVICHWPAAEDATRSLAKPDYEGVAIDFTDRSPAVELGRLAVAPPPYERHRIEQDCVARLDGFDYYAAMFRSVERALERTIGYCVMHEAEVVCEAVGGPMVRGIVEIGVGTKEAHQGKGLATVATACTMQACEALGLQPFWNAAQSNAPSVALARRLGFRTERPFVVRAWSKVDGSK